MKKNKIIITKDSPAAKVVNDLMASKADFKKAVESGKASEYAKTKPAKLIPTV